MSEPQTPELSHQDSVSFEVARDVLVALLGHAATRLDAPDVSEPERAAWGRRREEWASRLRGLQPRDVVGVQAVLENDASYLKSLSGR